MVENNKIENLLNELPPIGLDMMSNIKLMNRIDTKFVTNKKLLIDILTKVQGYYYVQEINGKRLANYRTTYWDTDNYLFYTMHYNGHKPRVKVRIRTYENLQSQSYLEVKKKDNHGRTKKKRMEIESHDFQITNQCCDFVRKQTKGINIEDLHPCMQNHFKRITLINKEKTERLTIDFDINYTNLDTKQNANSDNLVIIELKRDGRQESPIKPILLESRIKPHGYSKYVIGSCLTNESLKRNRLKRKLIEIDKINTL